MTGLFAVWAFPSAAQNIEIVRDGDVWIAQYEFPSDEKVWAFTRSAVTRRGQRPWRQGAWIVETPGVRLARIMDADGQLGHDVLLAEGDAIPRQVRIRFVPVIDDLDADYDPAMRFSDGMTALFTGHFTVVPWAMTGEPDATRADGMAIVLRDMAGPVRVLGEAHDTAFITNTPTYVIFGGQAPLRTDHLTAYIDGGLPGWLAARLVADIPDVLETYGTRLGPRKDNTAPILIVSWGGATPGRTSLGGSVLDGIVVMALEGEGLVEANSKALDDARWFIAHEAAHFWLSTTVGYESRADMWITEGGADLLAARATHISDPRFDPDIRLQAAVAQCADTLPRGSIARAFERRENRAYYACGAVFGMVAEAIAIRNGGDFFTFLNGLIAGEAAGDGNIGSDDWLAHLLATGGDAKLIARIASLLEHGSDAPEAALSALFDAADIAYVPNASGLPVLS